MGSGDQMIFTIVLNHGSPFSTPALERMVTYHNRLNTENIWESSCLLLKN